MSRLTDVALRVALKKATGERKELADGAVPNLSIRLGPGGATWTLKVRVSGERGFLRILLFSERYEQRRFLANDARENSGRRSRRFKSCHPDH